MPQCASETKMSPSGSRQALKKESNGEWKVGWLIA
jgi:hypothetical protein